MDTIIHKLNIQLNQNNFFIKRDDLIPQYYGGNKVRIVNEYYIDMIKNNCNCLIVYGSKNSNMCRVSSLLCAEKNILCYVIYGCDCIESEGITNGINDLIVENTKARIVNCTKNTVKDAVESVLKYTKEKGYKPYYIYGDSNGRGNEKVGARGYIKCYEEIKKYKERNRVQFDYIFVVNGTGITQTGLIAGKMLNGGCEKIVGISIARGKMVQEANINNYLNGLFNIEKLKNEIEVYDDVIQGGYGKIREENKRFIVNMSVKNSIPLDYTYVGKGMFGMMSYLKDRGINKKNILFIHTGATPLFYEDFLTMQN